MTPMQGAQELREWLQSQGFRVSLDGLRAQHNDCTWYAYRRSKIAARPCDCNDDKPGMQLVIRPFLSSLPDGRPLRRAEIEVTGEAGGIWYTLKAYSLDVDDVPSKLGDVERALIASWNALA